MGQLRLALRYRDRRRAAVDRLARIVVTGSGLMVLLTLMLIFIYLLYTVWPLFRPAALAAPRQIAVSWQAAPLALGMDARQQRAFRIDAGGVGQFIQLADGAGPQPGQVLLTQTLAPSSPRLLARSAGQQPLFVLQQPRGQALLVAADFNPAARGDDQPVAWRFPLGDSPLQLDPQQQELLHLALAQPAGEHYLLAAVTADQRVLLSRYVNGEVQPLALDTAPARVDQLLLTPDGRRLMLLTGEQLWIFSVDGEEARLLEKVALAPQGPLSLTLLPGGSSLLVSERGDNISQWFEIQQGEQQRLSYIRGFSAPNGDDLQLVAEPQRRVFATLSAEGQLTLFSAQQSDSLLQQSVVPDIRQLVFAPGGDALLAESPQGWFLYPLSNPYPDITLRTLWQKVWYENYPQPAYIWQSTSASDDYQAKFSLVPMVFGTLKAALYAMLFATPLALAGAAYTAYFMAPGLRRVIKPALEMMGALPTVVVGLIAGIWLAPQIERYLSAVLLLPFLLALAVLLTGWCVSGLQGRWRRLSAGYDVLWLIPVLLLTAWLTFSLASSLELWLFGQPLHVWLGDDFEQRNVLVVGVALGFALIPVIFSLAEDALFSIPASLSQGSLALGASSWQTLIRIVLPSASAGIFSALMIGFGRAVGETMIVLMATGNTPTIDGGIFQGLRSLAANIAIEMPEAAFNSGHYRVLFLSALALFIFTFVLNSLAELVRMRLRERYSLGGESL